mmetsp:Transcript_32731/g.56958  ORF Transcript_32731/g.56958 Transcript_32731/m.56958 type:complete len:914 (-) Transcript_32731:778-3519(-)
MRIDTTTTTSIRTRLLPATLVIVNSCLMSFTFSQEVEWQDWSQLLLVNKDSVLVNWPSTVGITSYLLKLVSRSHLPEKLPVVFPVAPVSTQDLVPSPTVVQPHIFFLKENKICQYRLLDGKNDELMPVVEGQTVFKDLSMQIRPQAPLKSAICCIVRHVKDSLYVCIANTQDSSCTRVRGKASVMFGKAEDLPTHLVVLAEDGDSLSLYNISSMKEPEGAIYLSSNCDSIYWTPLEDGAVLLYYFQAERKLCFSQSKSSGLMEDVAASDEYTFKLTFEETVAQCIWNNNKLAVSTSKRVLLLDQDLKLLKSIKAVATSLYWFGHVLLYSTDTAIFYCSLKTPPTCVLHSESQVVIAGVLSDRLILAQAGPIFTTRPLLATELLITSLFEEGDYDGLLLDRTVKHMETSLVSDNLINALIAKKKPIHAWFLLQTPSITPHMSLVTRIRAMWFLKKYEAIIELLTAHVSSDSVEAVHDYNYKLELKLMQKLAPQLERVGQLKLAGRCYALTRNYEELLKLVLQLGSLSAEEHSDLADRLGQGSIVKIPKINDMLKLDRCELENLPIKEVSVVLERQKLSYGEAAFLVETFNHEELNTPVSDNLSQFLGYNSLHEPLKRTLPAFVEEEAEPTEEDLLVVYLHCDEGRGSTIADVITGKTWDVNPEIWGDQILDGEPLEKEDKWGKAAPAAYSLEVSGDCKLSLTDLSDRAITPFCIEVWVRPYSPDGALFTFYPIKLVISNFKLRLIIHDRPVPLEVELSQHNWQHLALSYEAQVVNLYLNGTLASTIEEQLPGFSDLTLGEEFEGSFTELRVWKKPRTIGEISENMHGPLEILSEKRKKKWAAIKINKTTTSTGKLAAPPKLNPLAKPPLLPSPLPAGPRLLKPPSTQGSIFKSSPNSSARFKSSFEEDKSDSSR